VRATRIQALRYGENPDQAAAFYGLEGFAGGLAGLAQLHGKELSYNNLLDLDGALLALSPFAFSPGRRFASSSTPRPADSLWVTRWRRPTARPWPPIR